MRRGDKERARAARRQGGRAQRRGRRAAAVAECSPAPRVGDGAVSCISLYCGEIAVAAVIPGEHLELLRELLAQQEAEQRAALVDWAQVARVSPPHQPMV